MFDEHSASPDARFGKVIEEMCGAPRVFDFLDHMQHAPPINVGAMRSSRKYFDETAKTGPQDWDIAITKVHSPQSAHLVQYDFSEIFPDSHMMAVHLILREEARKRLGIAAHEKLVGRSTMIFSSADIRPICNFATAPAEYCEEGLYLSVSQFQSRNVGQDVSHKILLGFAYVPLLMHIYEQCAAYCSKAGIANICYVTTTPDVKQERSSKKIMKFLLSEHGAEYRAVPWDTNCAPWEVPMGFFVTMGDGFRYRSTETVEPDREFIEALNQRQNALVDDC